MSSLTALYILEIDSLVFLEYWGVFKVLFFFRRIANKFLSYSTVILCVKGGYKWSWSLAALEPGGIPPAWHWSPDWYTQGPRGLRPRPTDTAAPSPFEGSTSSKVECVSQRHTHTNSEDTRRMLTWLVTGAAMQTALP